MAERERKKPKKPQHKDPDNPLEELSKYMDEYYDYKLAKEEYKKMNPDYVDESSSDSGKSGNQVLPQEVPPPQKAKTEDQSNDYKKISFQNRRKEQDYDFLMFDLLYFLSDHLPGIKVNEEVPAHELAQMVKDVITDYQTKFDRFNLELKEIPGNEVAGHIKDHHRKVMEVIEKYEESIKAANDEVAQCRSQIAHLDAELTAALTKMQYLEYGTAYYGNFEDSMSEEQFMADLQGRVARCASLNSSMARELQRNQEENRGLKQQLAFLARQRVETEEKCMQEIAELSNKSELCARMENALESMIKGDKEPDSEVCQDIIDRWKKEINQAIDKNSKEIDELFKRHESQEKEKADLVAQAQQLEEELEKLRSEIKHSKSLSEKKFEEHENEYLQHQRKEESIFERDEAELMGDKTPPRPHPPTPLSSRGIYFDQLLPNAAQAPETSLDVSDQWMEFSQRASTPPLSSTFRDQSRRVPPPRHDLSSIRSPTQGSRTSQRATSRSPTASELMEHESHYGDTPTRTPPLSSRPTSVSPTASELMENQSDFDETPPRPPPLSSRGVYFDQLQPAAGQAPETPYNVSEQLRESSARASTPPLSSTFRDQSRRVPPPRHDLSSIRSPTQGSRTSQRATSRSPTASELMEHESHYGDTQPRTPPLSSRPTSVSPTASELMENLSYQSPPRPPPLSSRGVYFDQLQPAASQAPETPRNVSDQWKESSQRASTPPLSSTFRDQSRRVPPPRHDLSSIRSPTQGSRTSQRATSRLPTASELMENQSTFSETPPRPQPLSSRPASRTATRTGPHGGMPLSTPRVGRPGGRLGMAPVTPKATTPPRRGMRPTGTRAGTPPRPRIPAQQPAAPRAGQSQRSRIQGPTGPRTGASQRSATAAPRATGQRAGASQISAIPVPRATGPKTRTPQRSGTRPADASPPGVLEPISMNLDQLLADFGQAQGLRSRVMLMSPLSSRVVMLSPIPEESLPLDVDVTAQNIIPSDDGEQFTAQVAVGVHEITPGPERQNTRRARRPRPTPKSIFQR